MKWQPGPQELAQIKRRCHKIYAMYETDPDKFWLQHAMIRDMGAQDYGTEVRIEYDDDDSER